MLSERRFLHDFVKRDPKATPESVQDEDPGLLRRKWYVTRAKYVRQVCIYCVYCVLFVCFCFWVFFFCIQPVWISLLLSVWKMY